MKWYVIAMLLILLTACQTTKKQAGSVFDYRTGSEGLQIQFVPNLPPSTLYETEDLNVMLDVYNVGASKIGGSGDRIYLSGFDPRIITGIPSTGMQIPSIEGKSQYNSQGDFDRVSFNGVISRLQGDMYPAPLLATACYEYTTIASSTVCVDPDPFGTGVRTKVCTPTSLGMGSQGGPVAVSNIEVDARPGKTAFRIHVSNVGGGDVFKLSSSTLARCNPYDSKGLSYDELDYVQLADVQVGGTSIRQSCKPLDNGDIPLRSGSGTVYCEYGTNGNNAYVTPITVTLNYAYRQQTRRDVQIYKTG